MKLPRETISVLWHPEGEPCEVSAVVLPSPTVGGWKRYYAENSRGQWYILTSAVAPAGWRAPVCRLRSGLRGLQLRLQDAGGVA